MIKGWRNNPYWVSYFDVKKEQKARRFIDKQLALARINETMQFLEQREKQIARDKKELVT